jgi:hypothetical protein
MQTPNVSRNTQHLLRIAHSGLRVAYYVLRYVSPLCIILLGLANPANAQDDVTFTASVDRSTITTDDLLTLQLTLTGAFNNANQPQLPVLEGFAVVGSSQSSQFSIVNGRTSSQVVFTYRLQPIETGSLTIPAIPIKMDGQTYRTEPIGIEVAQGSSPQAQQPTREAHADTSAPGELSGQNIYVEAEVDNLAPVVGQQIVYHFRLYQAVNLLSQPQLSWPNFTGFLGYELSPSTQYYQQAAGKQYLVTEVRRALFPTAGGQVTIGPATLTVPGDFFNRGVQLQTQEVTVNVHPLPEGPPEDFAGAVGQFEIEAWIEPAEGRVNEPVTLFVRVFGAGNVSTLPDPTQGVEETLLGWRVYDPQVTTDVSQDGDVIQGEKLFERPLVPKTDGDLTIPPLALSYYDPEAGMYHRVETEPLAVRVAPGEAQTPGPVFAGTGKQDVVVLASDIRHIKPAPPALVTNHTSLLEQPFYWLGWGMPLLTVAGTWLWDRRRQHLAHDIAYARAQRARRHARQRLSEARKLVRTGKSEDENAAYATVAHAVTSYLGDKLDLPAAGLMRNSTQQALSTSSVPTELIDRVLACLDWADSGRFAPVAAGRKAEDLVQEAEEIIARLEESIT